MEEFKKQEVERDWLQTKYPDLYQFLRVMEERISGLNKRVLELEKKELHKLDK